MNDKAKIKNKFVSPYPTDPVKEICRLFFFVSLKIPYFRFVSSTNRYFRITEHIFVVKKKKRSLRTYPLPKLWVGQGETEIFF